LEIVGPVESGYFIDMFFCNFSPPSRVGSALMSVFLKHDRGFGGSSSWTSWIGAVLLLIGLSMLGRLTAAGAEGTNDVAARQILKRFVEVSGGEATLRKLTNRLSIGSFEAPAMGFQGTIEFIQSVPRRTAQKLIIANAATLQMATDGKIAWIEAPGMGVQLMDGLQRDQFIEENDLMAVLDFPTRFTNAMVLPAVEIAGVSCVPVTGFNRLGKKETMFFGKESGLLIRWDRPKLDPSANWTDTETIYENYQTVDGAKLPFKVSQKIPADQAFILVLTSVTHEIEPKPERFKQPSQ
jgi:hypothetical protein